MMLSMAVGVLAAVCAAVRDAALAAMTLVPAEVLRIDEQVGSIEAGKSANLLFLDGDPFEVGTEIKAVMLEGELTFMDEEDED